MDDQLCSSLVFKLTNDNAIYDILDDITASYVEFSLYFLLYGGPAFVAANLFVIIVLTRKELRSAYNLIFLLMALNQAVTIFSRDILLYQTFVWYDFGSEVTLSLAWRIFEMIITHFCSIFSAHVSWLAVIVTFVRLRHLRSSISEPTLSYMSMLSIVSFLLIIVASIPQFLSYTIIWIELPVAFRDEEYDVNKFMFRYETRSVPFIAESENVYMNDCLLLRISYFSSGFLFNALPCVLLIGLSAALIYELQKFRKNHIVVGRKTSMGTSVDARRSSWMIAMIVISTLITDVPQAIINILVGFMNDRFRSSVASRLSSMMITLIMIAAACNLAIHVCMSRRFREVAASYLCCVCNRLKHRKKRSCTILK